MDHSETWQALRRLSGLWLGTGQGEFPTIDAFGYRERLEVVEPGTAGLLHYYQQTWRMVGNIEEASHIETGFITLADNGEVEVLSAQGDDRVEVLRGRVTIDDLVTLDLKSVVIGHDERMLWSRRVLELRADELTYEMSMATTAVPKGAKHLAARLTRA